MCFQTNFRRVLTANPKGQIESEGGVGEFSVRRVSRYLQTNRGPRRSPSACAEMSEKNALGGIDEMDCGIEFV